MAQYNIKPYVNKYQNQNYAGLILKLKNARLGGFC